VATRALAAAIAAVSIAALPERGKVLEQLLAKTPELLAGEWWRLVTPAFVHGGLLHLAFNIMALLNLGALAEALTGRLRFLAVFFLGTAAATGASAWWSPDRVSVGASGGVFALVGALLAFGLRHRRALPEPARRRLVRDMIWIVGVNLVLGQSIPYIDNSAHVGGLVGGLLLGLLLPPGPETRSLLQRGEVPR
jgi:rhomboid protease GluP